MDLAIIGGGLSGSLLALALQKFHPEIQLQIHEESGSPCGNHTWCFHEGDIPPELETWVKGLASKTWSGYEVHFPSHSRHLAGNYYAIKSEDLSALIQKKLGARLFLNSKIETPEAVKARAHILCTGWRSTLNSTQLGWQKFVGLELELEKPHGLSKPILKDVLQKQTDGYRFVYSLPFTDTSVLVEDTYYSNTPNLDVDAIETGIKSYANSKSWKIKSVLRKEIGSLPLFLDLPPEDLHEKWPRLGAGSQFVNPVTGYTVPFTLRAIADLMKLQVFSTENMKKVLHETYHQRRANLQYLSLLNRMMFLAADPEKRYRILERFYKLPEPLIERFYAGNLTLGDQVRILTGKPPVPIFAALKALTKDLTQTSR